MRHFFCLSLFIVLGGQRIQRQTLKVKNVYHSQRIPGKWLDLVHEEDTLCSLSANLREGLPYQDIVLETRMSPLPCDFESTNPRSVHPEKTKCGGNSPLAKRAQSHSSPCLIPNYWEKKNHCLRNSTLQHKWTKILITQGQLILLITGSCQKPNSLKKMV